MASSQAGRTYYVSSVSLAVTAYAYGNDFTDSEITGSLNDVVTLAVQYAGGTNYVFVSPSPNSTLTLESVVQPGTYLAEHSGLGRGVNTLVGGSFSSYYGIDILFSTINP